MRSRLLVALVLAVAVGVVGVALAVGQGDQPGPAKSRRESAPAGSAAPVAPAAPAAAAPTIALVRRADGVPASWARRAAAVPGVERVVLVRRGQVLLRRSVDASGRPVDRVRSGFAIPLDTVVADPRAYAQVLPAGVRDQVAGIGSREAVLSRTGARLRRVGPGARLTFAGEETVRVAAVVDDVHLNGAELLVGRRAGAAVDTRAAHLLVRLASPAVERPLKRAFAGERVRVVVRGAPASSGGGAPIALPVELKVRFGEVAVGVPYAADWVRLDPAWVRANIVSRRVPILGSVTCNRRMLPALSAALGELRRRGLARLVDRGDYAGCYAPRRIPSTGSLSLHALGLAVDLNASVNAQYGRSNQDPRLVRIMERHGFTWGGRWPTAPDPMHFEFQGG